MPIGEWVFWLWLVLVAVLVAGIVTVYLTGRAIERRLVAIQRLLERLDGGDD